MGNRRKPRQHERAAQTDEVRPHSRNCRVAKIPRTKGPLCGTNPAYRRCCMLPSPSPPPPCMSGQNFVGTEVICPCRMVCRKGWAVPLTLEPSPRWLRRSQSAILEAEKRQLQSQSRTNRDWRFFRALDSGAIPFWRTIHKLRITLGQDVRIHFAAGISAD